MAATAQLKINLPVSLLSKLEPVLLSKGLTVDDACRLYLRSLVTTSERSRAVDLDDELAIGKFKGEILRVVIQAEPRYISWLLAQSGTFKITPAALSFLEEVQARQEQAA